MTSTFNKYVLHTLENWIHPIVYGTKLRSVFCQFGEIFKFGLKSRFWPWGDNWTIHVMGSSVVSHLSMYCPRTCIHKIRKWITYHLVQMILIQSVLECTCPRHFKFGHQNSPEFCFWGTGLTFILGNFRNMTLKPATLVIQNWFIFSSMIKSKVWVLVMKISKFLVSNQNKKRLLS